MAYPSFVVGKNFWAPRRSGQYGTDCLRGRFYADELVEYLSETESPTLMVAVMRAITTGGQSTGVEIGFFSRLGECLLAASGIASPAAYELPTSSLAQNIRERARKAQRAGRAGDAVKLHMLASETATIKEMGKHA